jgi:hypothetical protein
MFVGNDIAVLQDDGPIIQFVQQCFGVDPGTCVQTAILYVELFGVVAGKLSP